MMYSRAKRPAVIPENSIVSEVRLGPIMRSCTKLWRTSPMLRLGILLWMPRLRDCERWNIRSNGPSTR